MCFTRTTDYTGAIVGRWTVLEYLGGTRYRCVCRCGNERELLAREIRRGKIRSCGCLRRENASNLYALYKPPVTRGRLKDETDKRYGHWQVLSNEVRGTNAGYWRCRCVCGKERVVSGVELRSGGSKSCGCAPRAARRALTPRRPRRDESKVCYFSNAEMTELILAWQKEEEPSLMTEILAKLARLIKRLISMRADWYDGGARAELESDLYLTIRGACKRFVPGYSVYSYFYNVLHYAIIDYWRRYREWMDTFVSLDAPLEEGEELTLTLYDVLPAPPLLMAV